VGWGLRNAQAEVAVDQHDFAVGHDLVADDEVDGIGDVAIELDDIAGAEAEHFAELQFAATEAQRGFQFHIEEKTQARALGRLAGATLVGAGKSSSVLDLLG
jgi:hypothetical protein